MTVQEPRAAQGAGQLDGNWQQRREAISDPTADSGQVELLADGSVSIPIYEEVLVKQRVLRERVILSKVVVEEQREVTTELRRERVVVEQVDDDGTVSVLFDSGR